MWLMPALLAASGLYLARTPLDLARTLRDGTPATARVAGVVTTNRSEVSFDEVLLVIPRAGADSLRTALPVPHSVFQLVERQRTLPVRVLPGSAQPVVIEGTVWSEADGTTMPVRLGSTQMWIAGMSAAVSLVGAALLAWGIFAWNRYLARHGDPGEQAPPAAAVAPAV